MQFSSAGSFVVSQSAFSNLRSSLSGRLLERFNLTGCDLSKPSSFAVLCPISDCDTLRFFRSEKFLLLKDVLFRPEILARENVYIELLSKYLPIADTRPNRNMHSLSTTYTGKRIILVKKTRDKFEENFTQIVKAIKFFEVRKRRSEDSERLGVGKAYSSVIGFTSEKLGSILHSIRESWKGMNTFLAFQQATISEL